MRSSADLESSPLLKEENQDSNLELAETEKENPPESSEKKKSSGKSGNSGYDSEDFDLGLEDLDESDGKILKIDWKALSVPALREALKSRGLETKGLKAVLVTRLKDSDEIQETPPNPKKKAPTFPKESSTGGVGIENNTEGEGGGPSSLGETTSSLLRASPTSEANWREALTLLDSSSSSLFEGSSPGLYRRVELLRASILLWLGHLEEVMVTTVRLTTVRLTSRPVPLIAAIKYSGSLLGIRC